MLVENDEEKLIPRNLILKNNVYFWWFKQGIINTLKKDIIISNEFEIIYHFGLL